MTTQRFLSFLAATIFTVGQALILVTDTAASAEAVLTSVAYQAQSSGGSSNA